MKRRVWKYPLPLPSERNGLLMPAGAEVVHVALQDHHITLWALIDPSAAPTARAFLIHPTGEAITDDETYVGTVQHDVYMWHIFEVPA